MNLKDLLEALKPSEYREYVKGWDKTKYADIFQRYTTDKKGFRIYIPLKGEPKKVDPDSEVEAAVKEAGYEIEDYVTGIASKDDGKRKIKIGKLLKDPKLQQKFANDPKRAASKHVENFVVISRHPYDIAGMSTDRGWRSCMNLHGGVNRHYIPMDVKEGTLVAYLVKSDDKNINNPVARVLIKPFLNIDAKADSNKRVALGVEDRVYGTSTPGFRETVVKWVDEVNDSKKLDGVFEFNDRLYNDGGTKDTIGVGPTGKLYQTIKNNPEKIGEIERPDDSLVQLALKKSYGTAVLFLKNPSKDSIISALKVCDSRGTTSMMINLVKGLIEKRWIDSKIREYIINHVDETEAVLHLPDLTDDELISLIENNSDIFRVYTEEIKKTPSKRVIEAAIDADADNIQYVDDPSEDLQLKTIEINPSTIKLIKKPTKKVLTTVIEKRPSLIDYIDPDLITDEIAELAFSKDPNLLNYLKKRTAAHIDIALAHNGSLIKNLDEKEQTNDRVMAALKNTLFAMRYVHHPSEEAMLYFLKEGGDYSYIVHKNPSVKVKLEALKSDFWETLDSMRDETSREIQEYAIEKDANSIRYFSKVPEDLQLKAIEKDPTIIDDIEDVSDNAVLKALPKYPKAIRYLENPTEEQEEAAVKSDPEVIRYIHTPSESLIMLAAEKDFETLRYVRGHREGLSISSGFNEKIQLAALKSLKKSEKVEDYSHIFENATSNVLLKLVKKFPNSGPSGTMSTLTNFASSNWTLETVQISLDCKEIKHSQKELIFNRVKKNPKKWKEDRGFTPEAMQQLTEKMADHKKRVADEAKELTKMKSIKPVVIKDNEDPRLKKLLEFIKANRPVVDLDLWRSVHYGLREYLSHVYSSIFSSYYIDRNPDPAWKFDSIYANNVKKSNHPRIGFFKDGEVVGYVDGDTGYAFYPLKKRGVKLSKRYKVSLEESGSFTTFKKMLQEMLDDETE